MNQLSPALRDTYIATIEAENELLRERVKQLEQEVGFRIEVPLIFGLTGSEARILGVLLKREVATKETLLLATTKDATGNLAPEIKIVDVFICKMRKKLTPFGIVIETVWGQGYRMLDDSKALVGQYLNGTQLAPTG